MRAKTRRLDEDHAVTPFDQSKQMTLAVHVVREFCFYLFSSARLASVSGRALLGRVVRLSWRVLGSCLWAEGIVVLVANIVG